MFWEKLKEIHKEYIQSCVKYIKNTVSEFMCLINTLPFTHSLVFSHLLIMDDGNNKSNVEKHGMATLIN